MIEEPVRRRRRGEELEGAILAAAWDELVAVGYFRLTMGSVAVRAGTSEPVLYRRWPNKEELVFAAIAHHRRLHPIEVADTGALRTDLIAQLTALGEALGGYFAVVVAAASSGLMADTGLAPAQLRERVIGVQEVPDVRDAYRRARERGELDLERIPSAVLEMPFDLLRHDLLLGDEPIPAERIRSIVDDLFLPLVTPHRW